MEFKDVTLAEFSHLLIAVDVLALTGFVALKGWLEKYSRRVRTSSRQRYGEYNFVI
jgi:hypothetical protein